MIPCSSPRSSGCLATDWIIEAKMLPMPTPAPTAPSPTPRPKAIAWPSLTCGAAAARNETSDTAASLVFGLDRRADVDRGQRREDERLDRDDDDHLEEIEDDRAGQPEEPPRRCIDDEHEPDHHKDEHVAREHVREETYRERDQTHELRQDFDHGNRGDQHLGQAARNPALEVATGTVPPDPLEVREEEGDERKRERHGERGRGRVDPERRNRKTEDMNFVTRERKRQEAEHVYDPDEQEQRSDVGKPEADGFG